MADRHDDPFLDDPYFESVETRSETGGAFDAAILRQPLSVLPTRYPLLFAPTHTVTQAVRSMQKEHRGCVLITEDGSRETRVIGIFTERDVLRRIVDQGRNPATLPLTEVMTRNPECLPNDASLAWVLNKMSIGGFRHVPAIEPDGRPNSVVSVRDVVEFLVERFPREVLNLPPEFGADVSRTREGA